MAVVCGRPDNHVVSQSCPNLKSRDGATEAQEQISILCKTPPDVVAARVIPTSPAPAPRSPAGPAQPGGAHPTPAAPLRGDKQDFSCLSHGTSLTWTALVSLEVHS